MEKQFLSTDDICELWGISRATFYRWKSEQDHFPIPIVVGPNTVRYDAACVAAYVQACREVETDA